MTSIVLLWITTILANLVLLLYKEVRLGLLRLGKVIRRMAMKYSIMLMTLGASKVIYTLLHFLSKMHKYVKLFTFLISSFWKPVYLVWTWCTCSPYIAVRHLTHYTLYIHSSCIVFSLLPMLNTARIRPLGAW